MLTNTPIIAHQVLHFCISLRLNMLCKPYLLSNKICQEENHLCWRRNMEVYAYSSSQNNVNVM